MVVSIALPSVLAAVSPPRSKFDLAPGLLSNRDRLLVIGLKTPQACVCGVFLWLLFGSAPIFAECGQAEPIVYSVKKVIDGDTLRLNDGRSVRVLGINAPEVAHGKEPAQPLGQEARALAQTFVQRSDNQVRLAFEQQRLDRYGRSLAHVYDLKGRSWATTLLAAGMAMQISVPPNANQAGCLTAVELKARQNRIGVWRSHYWQVQDAQALSDSDLGFRLVGGRVVSVAINKSIWLELDGRLVVQIARKDWPNFRNQLGAPFKKQDWRALSGKYIEVRGWVQLRRAPAKGAQKLQNVYKPLIMQVRTAASLQLLSHSVD